MWESLNLCHFPRIYVIALAFPIGSDLLNKSLTPSAPLLFVSRPLTHPKRFPPHLCSCRRHRLSSHGSRNRRPLTGLLSFFVFYSLFGPDFGLEYVAKDVEAKEVCEARYTDGGPKFWDFGDVVTAARDIVAEEREAYGLSQSRRAYQEAKGESSSSALLTLEILQRASMERAEGENDLLGSVK